MAESEPMRVVFALLGERFGFAVPGREPDELTAAMIATAFLDGIFARHYAPAWAERLRVAVEAALSRDSGIDAAYQNRVEAEEAAARHPVPEAAASR